MLQSFLVDTLTQSGRSFIAQWSGRGLDWLLPPLCLACQTPIASPSGLCASCWQELRFIEPPICDRLGTPFPYAQGGEMVSAAALADPPPWHKARAAVLFSDVARMLIHALKYRDRHETASLVSRLMWRAGTDILGDDTLIVPVPLYRWRLWQRRYNQSALLAKEIAGLSGGKFRPDVLSRHRATRSQAGLGEKERRRNVKNAFSVPENRRSEVFGRCIVIVDDVLTTGATAGACTRALKDAGALRVDVLTFALVPQPRRLHIQPG